MRLGVCYMVFDGEELLEFAIKSIRGVVDYISATYQSISYFGNPADPNLKQTVERLKSQGLLDEIIHFEPDFSIAQKQNEVDLRNLGLSYSKKAGCTHHMSCDVDEFFLPSQMEYAKSVMDADNYDFSAVNYLNYYKDPTYVVFPDQNLKVSFIHPVDNAYDRDVAYPHFPFHMETTRRFAKYDKYRLFTKEEVTMHHMSYVRKDIRKKFANNDNKNHYKLEKFYKTYDNYKVGDRVCLLPDYLNRRTRQVENTFGITI